MNAWAIAASAHSAASRKTDHIVVSSCSGYCDLQSRCWPNRLHTFGQYNKPAAWPTKEEGSISVTNLASGVESINQQMSKLEVVQQWFVCKLSLQLTSYFNVIYRTNTVHSSV